MRFMHGVFKKCRHLTILYRFFIYYLFYRFFFITGIVLLFIGLFVGVFVYERWTRRQPRVAFNDIPEIIEIAEEATENMDSQANSNTSSSTLEAEQSGVLLVTQATIELEPAFQDYRDDPFEGKKVILHYI